MVVVVVQDGCRLFLEQHWKDPGYLIQGSGGVVVVVVVVVQDGCLLLDEQH